ncbi:MAG: hypothetical protein HYY40_02440 [Bacteroidetes bacterium]|nr:hypothetical protein [Bacteroidota bacterium]
MTHIVSIKDNSQNSKLLLSILRNFSATSKSVEFLTPVEIEEMEDEIFIKMMEAGRKSGKANTKEVMKKLDLK